MASSAAWVREDELTSHRGVQMRLAGRGRLYRPGDLLGSGVLENTACRTGGQRRVDPLRLADHLQRRHCLDVGTQAAANDHVIVRHQDPDAAGPGLLNRHQRVSFAGEEAGP